MMIKLENIVRPEGESAKDLSALELCPILKFYGHSAVIGDIPFSTYSFKVERPGHTNMDEFIQLLEALILFERLKPENQDKFVVMRRAPQIFCNGRSSKDTSLFEYILSCRLAFVEKDYAITLTNIQEELV